MITQLPRTSPGRLILTTVAIFLAVLAYATVFIATISARTYPIAPADGLVYVDAFDRAMAGRITVRGDRIGLPAIQLAACSELIKGQYRVWLVPSDIECNSSACKADNRMDTSPKYILS